MQNENRASRDAKLLEDKAIQLAKLYNKKENCPEVYFAPAIAAGLRTGSLAYVWQGRHRIPEIQIPRPPVRLRNHNLADLSFVGQLPEEFQLLADLLIRNNLCNVALEIGFGHGGLHMLLRELFNKVISVDFDPKRFLNFLGHLVVDDRSIFVCGDSRDTETRDIVRKFYSVIDMLYIDGDHEYDSVKSDYLMYSPLVKPGGIIAFHDSLSPFAPGVKRFVSELESGSVDGVVHKFGLFDAGTGVSYEIVPRKIVFRAGEVDSEQTDTKKKVIRAMPKVERALLAIDRRITKKFLPRLRYSLRVAAVSFLDSYRNFYHLRRDD